MHWKKRSQASKLMTRSEQTDLMVAPRLHLQMILGGQLDLEYLHSVAGVFNIAGALANYRHRRELEEAFDRAQLIMASLIQEVRAPTGEEAQQVTDSFNAADRLLRCQTKTDLAKVIAYVDRRIARGDVVKPKSRQGETA